MTSRDVTNDEIARDILDGTSYVVLATADAEGLPWASPVWFAQEDYREIFWVSYPGARHSQNIAARAHVGLVVFDSTVPAGSGQAVYMAAIAEQVKEPTAIEHGIAVYSRVSTSKGLEAFDRGPGHGPRPGCGCTGRASWSTRSLTRTVRTTVRVAVRP